MDYKTYKKGIIEHLKKKGNYSPEIDDVEIDELFENLTLYKESMKKLEEEGELIPYSYKPGMDIMRLNPRMNSIQQFKNAIDKCKMKLGINRADRIKMKLIEEKLHGDSDYFEKEGFS